MKKALSTILIGFLLIVLIDSIGSIVSRKMNFNYGYLFLFSSAIYIAIPFLIRKRVDKKAAIISAALLGLFDATIGWKISILLKANTGSTKLEIITPAVFIITIIFVTLTSTLFGLFGSWLASKFPR